MYLNGFIKNKWICSKKSTELSCEKGYKAMKKPLWMLEGLVARGPLRGKSRREDELWLKALENLSKRRRRPPFLEPGGRFRPRHWVHKSRLRIRVYVQGPPLNPHTHTSSDIKKRERRNGSFCVPPCQPLLNLLPKTAALTIVTPPPPLKRRL